MKAQRFSGDRSLYGSLELRIHLFDAGWFLPGRYWLFGLADAGRVWVDEEDSNEWHPSYGGGLLVEFQGTPMKLTAQLAENSDEGELRLYVGTGFTF
jgi:hemolysin activation/secretion protein